MTIFIHSQYKGEYVNCKICKKQIKEDYYYLHNGLSSNNNYCEKCAKMMLKIMTNTNDIIGSN